MLAAGVILKILMIPDMFSQIYLGPIIIVIGVIFLFLKNFEWDEDKKEILLSSRFMFYYKTLVPILQILTFLLYIVMIYLISPPLDALIFCVIWGLLFLLSAIWVYTLTKKLSRVEMIEESLIIDKKTVININDFVELKVVWLLPNFIILKTNSSKKIMFAIDPWFLIFPSKHLNYLIKKINGKR